MHPALQSLKGLLNAAVGLVYPEVCQICKNSRATPAESFICESCQRQIRFLVPPLCQRCGKPFAGEITQAFDCSHCREIEPHFRSARSAVIANDFMLDVVHRYKYSHGLWFEPFLGNLLVRAAVPELAQEPWTWIVPVPLHPAKLREREFNQAERLARRLSAATGVPLQTRLLRRVLPTRTQTLLSREERLANVRKAFAMRSRRKLQGEKIVLIDDVFTTGATTDACARVLKQAGAGDVCVWTVARGI